VDAWLAGWLVGPNGRGMEGKRNNDRHSTVLMIVDGSDTYITTQQPANTLSDGHTHMYNMAMSNKSSKGDDWDMNGEWNDGVGWVDGVRRLAYHCLDQHGIPIHFDRGH
jgi:hypothetical protein